MSLPKSSNITYELVVPSTKKKIKFSPFRVKEHKELLLAQQSEDLSVMVNTLKNVINSCVSSTDFDVERLAIFDLEYIFAQIRAKGAGEIAEMVFSCDVCEDEKASVKVGIDLTLLEVEFSEKHKNKILFSDGRGVIMSYPKIDIMLKLDEIDTETQAMFEIILGSIQTIFDADNLYAAADYTLEELTEFLDSVTIEDFELIMEFFQTIPKLKQKVEYTCPVCQLKHSKMIEGLHSFF